MRQMRNVPSTKAALIKFRNHLDDGFKVRLSALFVDFSWFRPDPMGTYSCTVCQRRYKRPITIGDLAILKGRLLRHGRSNPHRKKVKLIRLKQKSKEQFTEMLPLLATDNQLLLEMGIPFCKLTLFERRVFFEKLQVAIQATNVKLPIKFGPLDPSKDHHFSAMEVFILDLLLSIEYVDTKGQVEDSDEE